MQREHLLFRHVMERMGIGQTVTLAMNSFSFHSGGTAPDIVMFFAFQLKRRIVAQKSEGSGKQAKLLVHTIDVSYFSSTPDSAAIRDALQSTHSATSFQGRSQGNHNMQDLDVNS